MAEPRGESPPGQARARRGWRGIRPPMEEFARAAWGKLRKFAKYNWQLLLSNMLNLFKPCSPRRIRAKTNEESNHCCKPQGGLHGFLNREAFDARYLEQLEDKRAEARLGGGQPTHRRAACQGQAHRARTARRALRTKGSFEGIRHVQDPSLHDFGMEAQVFPGHGREQPAGAPSTAARSMSSPRIYTRLRRLRCQRPTRRRSAKVMDLAVAERRAADRLERFRRCPASGGRGLARRLCPRCSGAMSRPRA